MAKRSKASTVFSPPEIKRLHRRLAKRTLMAFWDVGRILNERFDKLPNKRAPFGGMEKIASALKACGGDAPISLSQLHQCRLLFETWGKKDVNAAEKVSLLWSRAIAMLSVWASAKDRGEKKMIERCRRLITKYPGPNRKKLKPWVVLLKALQKVGREGLSPESKARHLLEKKLAAVHRLQAFAQIMDDMREFLPEEEHQGCLGLKGQAEGMIPFVEMLCARETKAMP